MVNLGGKTTLTAILHLHCAAPIYSTHYSTHYDADVAITELLQAGGHTNLLFVGLLVCRPSSLRTARQESWTGWGSREEGWTGERSQGGRASLDGEEG